MNTKVRILAFLLAMALMTSMLPVSVLAEDSGEHEHAAECAAGCTQPAGHEGDCVVPKTCEAGCTQSAGHEGDCVVPKTCEAGCTQPAGHEGDCVVPKTCEAGCTQPAGHEGDCVVPKTCEKGCTQPAGHDGDCILPPVCSKQDNCEATDHEEGCLKAAALAKAQAEAQAREALNTMIAALPSPDEVKTYDDTQREAFTENTLRPIYTYAAEQGIDINGDLTLNAINEALNPSTEIPGEAVYVAQVGEREFETLQAAIDAANGETVSLLENVELAAVLSIAADKILILDLNGKTITTTKSGDSLYAFDNLGTLTLTDSKGGGKIIARGTKNHGTMTMNGGTIETADNNGGYGVWNYGGSSFTMNGGTLYTSHVGHYSGGNTSSGLRLESGATAQVNGGTIESKSVRTYAINSLGNLTITPAEGKTVTVKGPRALAVDGGKAIINGGTFESYDSQYVDGEYVAAETYYALYTSGGETVINGGTFKAAEECIMVEEGYTGSMTIAGGTFEKPFDVRCTAEDADITITGGTFSADPAAYVASGYKAVLTDGKYIVGVEKINATVNGKPLNGLTASAIVEEAEKADNSVVVLPDSTVSGLLTAAIVDSEKTDISLTVPAAIGQTETATVTFSNAAVRKIAEANDTVTLVVTNITASESKPTNVHADAVVYDISLVDSEGDPVFTGTSAAGEAVVVLPLPEGATPEDGLKVYFCDGTAKEDMAASFDYEKGTAAFAAEHFSVYSIEPEDHTLWYDPDQNEFTITTLEQLKGFAQLVNSGTTFQGKTVKLDADIDLNHEEWTPIGTSKNNPFLGTFDGQNHTISNLKVTNTESGRYFGLFGRIGNDNKVAATVKNTNINNVTLTGNTSSSYYVGAIAGHVKPGVIENCNVTGNITLSGYAGVSVIAGYSDGFSGEYTNRINNCHVSGTIQMNGVAYIGGFVGKAFVTTVSGCTIDGGSAASSAITGLSYTGGIVGFTDELGVPVVESCSVSNISIQATDTVGGIVGIAHMSNRIVDNTVTNVAVTATGTDGTSGMIAGCIQGAEGTPTILADNEVAASTRNGEASDLQTSGVSSTGAANANYFVGEDVVFNNAGKVLSGNFTVFNEAIASVILAANSGVSKNEDGTYSVSHYVAKIGETKYETLGEALAAGENQTVTLLEPVTASATVSKDVTLDLAGFKLEGTLTVNAGVALTLANTTTDTATGDGTGTILAPADQITKIVRAPSLTALTIPEGYEWYEENNALVLIKRAERTIAESFKQAVTATLASGHLEKPAALSVTTSEDVITYSSSNEAVATVDSTGKVTFVSVGETNITASVAATKAYQAVSASYKLTVTEGNLVVTAKDFEHTYDGAVHGFALEVKNDAGETVTGYTTVYNTTGPDADYSLNVAPTYINAGTYPVYYQVTANGKTVSGSVTVKINKASVAISYAKDTVVIARDGTVSNTLTKPGFVTVSYASSDNSVAEINASGAVAIKGPGTAIITATVVAGNNYNGAADTYELVVANGVELDSASYDETKYLLVYSTNLSSGDRTALDEAITGKFSGYFPNSAISYYDVSLYDLASGDLVHDVEVTFTLPYPSGVNAANYQYYGFTVLHKPHNANVEQVTDVSLTSSGVRITSEVSGFAFGAHNHTESGFKQQYDTANHWDQCKVCGEKRNQAKHSFGSWTTVRQATKTSSGLERRDCKGCDYYETRTYSWYMSPFTGDNMGRTIAILVAVMVVSGVSLAVILVRKFSKKKYNRYFKDR